MSAEAEVTPAPQHRAATSPAARLRPRPRPRQVVVVDDDDDFLADLVGYFNEDENVSVTRAARIQLDDAERDAVAANADIVLIGPALAEAERAELVRRLATSLPAARVALVGTNANEGDALAAIESGAAGYLAKDLAEDERATAVWQLMEGHNVIPTRLLPPLISRIGTPVGAARPTLSPREQAVLRLVARGESNAAIAASFAISVNTVRNHMQSILIKLGAHSKLEAVARAGRLNLLPPNR